MALAHIRTVEILNTIIYIKLLTLLTKLEEGFTCSKGCGRIHVHVVLQKIGNSSNTKFFFDNESLWAAALQNNTAYLHSLETQQPHRPGIQWNPSILDTLGTC